MTEEKKNSVLVGKSLATGRDIFAEPKSNGRLTFAQAAATAQSEIDDKAALRGEQPKLRNDAKPTI